MSAGAFDGLSRASPNQGLVTQAIARAVPAAESGATTLVSVSLSDLYAHRFPFSKSSFAHAFSVLVLPGFQNKGTYQARIYQAFGPPHIGYAITTCLGSSKHKNAQVLSANDLDEFVKGFETFEGSRKWDAASQKLYQSLFACKLTLPTGYPILCYTKIHEDTLKAESVRFMESILGCGDASVGNIFLKWDSSLS